MIQKSKIFTSSINKEDGERNEASLTDSHPVDLQGRDAGGGVTFQNERLALFHLHRVQLLFREFWNIWEKKTAEQTDELVEEMN